MSIENFAQTLLGKLKELSAADTVIGKALETPQGTVIPVSRMSVGFGIGNHTGKGESTGSGGGVSIEPVAFLVLKDDNIQLLPVSKNNSALHKALDLVPEIMDLFKKDKDTNS